MSLRFKVGVVSIPVGELLAGKEFELQFASQGLIHRQSLEYIIRGSANCEDGWVECSSSLHRWLEQPAAFYLYWTPDQRLIPIPMAMALRQGWISRSLSVLETMQTAIPGWNPFRFEEKYLDPLIQTIFYPQARILEDPELEEIYLPYQGTRISLPEIAMKLKLDSVRAQLQTECQYLQSHRSSIV